MGANRHPMVIAYARKLLKYVIFVCDLRGVDRVDEWLAEPFGDVLIELVEHITETVHL
jgi:hypothetical protein